MKHRSIVVDIVVYNVASIVYYLFDYIADNKEFRIYDFLDKNKTALIYFNRLASIFGSYDKVMLLLTSIVNQNRFIPIYYEVEVKGRIFKIGDYRKQVINIKYCRYNINLYKDYTENNRYYYMELLLDNMRYITGCKDKKEVLKLMDDEDLYERLEKGEK